MTAADLVDRLAEHKTLGAAPREELAWLASHGFLRELRAGDVLTAKGAQVGGLFVVLSGRIAMFVDRGAGRHRLWNGGKEPSPERSRTPAWSARLEIRLPRNPRRSWPCLVTNSRR